MTNPFEAQYVNLDNIHTPLGTSFKNAEESVPR